MWKVLSVLGFFSIVKSVSTFRLKMRAWVRTSIFKTPKMTLLHQRKIIQDFLPPTIKHFFYSMTNTFWALSQRNGYILIRLKFLLYNPVNKMNEDIFLLSFLQMRNSIRIKFEYIFVILTLLLRVLKFLLCKTLINIERSSINIYLDEEIFFTVLHIIRLKRAQNPIIFWKSGIQNSWKMSYT